jgi:4-amino-4-deoxy-L-arabinose transferase-like glycosyltransferase
MVLLRCDERPVSARAALSRLAAILPRTPRGRLALAWALAVGVAAAVTAPAVGISRDESVYLEAGASYARFWGEAIRSPGSARALADARFAPNHEHPPLAKTVFGVTRAILSDGLGWTGRVQGSRFGAFLFAALLAALLATWGFDLAGPGGALLAPSLFFLAPRHFYHAHPAVLDLPVTALWLATAYAFHRSLRARGDRRRHLAWAVAAGLAFGAALATKHNAWFLPPLLLASWLLSSVRTLRRDPLHALAGLPLAIPAMAVIGPLVLVGSWPWLWHDTVPRLREYLAFHLHHENYPWLWFGRLLREPPFPWSYPFVVTALTVPAASLAAMGGGLLQALGRIAAAMRGRDGEVRVEDEVLLVLNALFPIALIAWPTVPIFGGVKHWLPAMPFLALLGARALVTAGRRLAPSRPWAVTGALAALALAPAAWQVARNHPFGTAAWNELAGGAPGAASLGMQRQFWGDAVVAVLPELSAHAAPGARVWFQETTWLAMRQYQLDGRLRTDLVWANGPEDADVSLWQPHAEFRDREYRTWTALGTSRPVAGVYLDEVPLVQVYARAGAWR